MNAELTAVREQIGRLLEDVTCFVMMWGDTLMLVTVAVSVVVFTVLLIWKNHDETRPICPVCKRLVGFWELTGSVVGTDESRYSDIHLRHSLREVNEALLGH